MKTQCWLAVVAILSWWNAGYGMPQVPLGINQDGLPSIRYPQIFRDYYQGEFNSAGRDFRQQANTAYQDSKGLYLDSACYWVMQAECYRELGNLAEAVELYEQSLKLYGDLVDWDARTQFPPTINPDLTAWQTAQIGWGTPRRQIQVARVPSLQTFFGNTDEQNRIVAQQGGVLQPGLFRTVDMSEMMRCVGLAAYRRWQVKGTLCRHDPFTNQIAATGAKKFAANGTLPAVWNGVLLGIAQASSGKREEAAATLQQSLHFNQSLDHSLTPLALLALADLAWLDGNQASARDLYLEASYAAAVQYQYDLVGDALAGATRCDLRARNANILPALNLALQWANRENADALAARLLLETAKVQAEVNQIDSAQQMLAGMAQLARGNDLGKTRLGIEYNYLGALIAFQLGDATEGLNDLGTAVKTWARLAPRAYQIGLTDQFLRQRTMTPRQADLTYSELLRDPTAEDWLTDPIDSLAYMMVDHTGSLQLWFDALLSERKVEPALALVDRIQRHRFAATQPIGGRLLALRWLLETPESLLTPEALAQRKDLLARYPDYAALASRGADLVTTLRGLPLVADSGSPDESTLQDTTAQLAEAAQQQENYLAWIALRREPIEPMFDRDVTLTGSDSVVPPRTAMIVMQDTTQGLHVFSVIDGVGTLEAALNRRQVTKDLGDLLKSLGVESEKNPVDLSEFPEAKWKAASDKLYKTIFPKRELAFWTSIEEIVIVPDGVLWYAPWDLLLNPAGASPGPRIRCCPLIALAIPNASEPPRFPRSLLAVGSFSDQKLAPIVEQLIAGAKATISSLAERRAWKGTPTGVYGAAIDQLVVWAPLTRLDEKTLASLSLAQIEDERTDGTLDTWLRLPFAGPRAVVVPFWSTAAASGRLGNGEEMFQASCDLLAQGAQTALVSRWYTGVTTSCQTSLEFTRHLGSVSAIDAWQAALLATRELPLDQGEGSRWKKPKTPLAETTSSHPFFWAGYLLIDTGWRPDAAGLDAETDAPAAGQPTQSPPTESKPTQDKPGATPARESSAAEPSNARPALTTPPPPDDKKPDTSGSGSDQDGESPENDRTPPGASAPTIHPRDSVALSPNLGPSNSTARSR